jgi:lysine 2,3-aminomutase
MPNYLVSASNEAVVLRNYEGMLVRYNPDGNASPGDSSLETQGVSALLSGKHEMLMPENTPRMLRRRAIAAIQQATAAQTPLSTRGSGRPKTATVPSNGDGQSRRNGNNGPARRSGLTTRQVHDADADGSEAHAQPVKVHKGARSNGRGQKAAVQIGA